MESVGVCSNTLVLTSMEGYAFRNSTEIKTCLTMDGMCSPDHAAAAAVWERDTVSSVGLFSGSSILKHQRPPTHRHECQHSQGRASVSGFYLVCNSSTSALLIFLEDNTTNTTFSVDFIFEKCQRTSQKVKFHSVPLPAFPKLDHK